MIPLKNSTEPSTFPSHFCGCILVHVYVKLILWEDYTVLITMENQDAPYLIKRFFLWSIYLQTHLFLFLRLFSLLWWLV